MTKNGNSAEKNAARRIQKTLGVAYTAALRSLREDRQEGETWSAAADRIIGRGEL